MTEEFRADEWMDANHRMLKVWTDLSQRWLAGAVSGNHPVADKPVLFDDVYGLTGKLLSLTESFGELLRETGRYQAYFMPVWFEIWQHFLRDNEHVTTQPGSFEGAMNVWFDYANTELVALQTSEEYLEVNQRIGQALTEFKTCQGRLTEDLLTRANMPTQQEVDNLARTLFELKREVRRLKEVKTVKQQSRVKALPRPVGAEAS